MHPQELSVLITGGTSGLGLELVRIYLHKGFEVITTGRKSVHPLAPHKNLTYYPTDLDDLTGTSETARLICTNHHPCIVINNAGILSPPKYIATKNGLEYTFQVNFLAHLLLNEIILGNNPPGHALKTVTITSMAYRAGDTDLVVSTGHHKYRPWKAYSNSKLYLALMCRHLRSKYPDPVLRFVGFDPGIFSSGIYRMQKKWFGVMYRIGAPFMRNPAKVANRIGELIESNNLIDGSVYDFRYRMRTIREAGKTAEARFWEECYGLIGKYLQN
jgi:NAD(P)-dependent dehydrogenase (short-subunit alcohol dehydrogenase family)